MQEAQLLAWRGLGGYQGRAPLRHWLYRITTTTCLKMIEPAGRAIRCHRRRRRLSAALSGPAARPAHRRRRRPGRRVERRDSVALAFIAAMQLLPATQRAVLILRDVLACSPAEIADLLDTSVAAVNSAAATRPRHPAATPAAAPRPRPLDADERQVVDAFVDAWQRRDIPALAALLREDAILRMPPQRSEFTGRDAVAEFFATVPADGRLDLIRPRRRSAPTASRPLAAYLPDEQRRLPRLRDHGPRHRRRRPIATITGFPDADLFAAFGLPPQRPAT